MLPNDVFKRPGPHHAHEVERAKRDTLCEALGLLEEVGLAEPLAEVLAQPVEAVLDGRVFHDLAYQCVAEPDFGLATYGPMLIHAGLPIVVGEALFPQKDPTVEPISPWWAEHRPYLPGRLASAAELLDASEVLVKPSAVAWARLREALVDPEVPESELDPAERPDALITSWREACAVEVATYRSRLSELTKRGAWVATWTSEEGWL